MSCIPYRYIYSKQTLFNDFIKYFTYKAVYSLLFLLILQKNDVFVLLLHVNNMKEIVTSSLALVFSLKRVLNIQEKLTLLNKYVLNFTKPTSHL